MSYASDAMTPAIDRTKGLKGAGLQLTASGRSMEGVTTTNKFFIF